MQKPQNAPQIGEQFSKRVGKDLLRDYIITDIIHRVSEKTGNVESFEYWAKPLYGEGLPVQVSVSTVLKSRANSNQPEYEIFKTIKSGNRIVEIKKPKNPLKDYEVTLIYYTGIRRKINVWLISPEFLSEISKLTDEQIIAFLEDGF